MKMDFWISKEGFNDDFLVEIVVEAMGFQTRYESKHIITACFLLKIASEKQIALCKVQKSTHKQDLSIYNEHRLSK